MYENGMKNMEEYFRCAMQQEHPCTIKRKNLLYYGYTSVSILIIVWTNKKDPSSKVDGSCSKDDSVDIWLYEIG